ncbi:hypothetical protein T440DRAFT_62170 [Plenodomus tracheiphilus IPT5]|uniref:Apple domain-containing protein n=1 Tax=Plenodomus tracheiphilus IPT5 TaxID=1408161 RepID=A0A6A7B7H2_9PLEO|nr:hypothetical protein T440DRAFT_62170 [Plenodomus tracheiphilus IPT5]
MIHKATIPLSFLAFLSYLIASVSAATICGFVGIHDANVLNQYMGNFFYNGPSNFALCAAWCKNDPNNCRSFRYSYYGDANAQYCEFFDSGLDGNVTADNTQPYFYYDIGCGFPDFIAPTTVTTTVGDGSGGGVQTVTTTVAGGAGQIITTTSTATFLSTTTQTQITTSVQPASTVTSTQFTTTTVARQTITRAVLRTVTRSVVTTRTITRRGL